MKSTKAINSFVVLGGVIALAATAQQVSAHGWFQNGEQPAMGERPGHEEVFADHAELLGLSAEELQQELDSGKTFHDVLEEEGIAPEEVHEYMKTQRSERMRDRLNQLVADGTITQEEANERMERRQQFQESHDCSFGPRAHGYRAPPAEDSATK